MNDTLKVASRIGAELGAAKAENEKLRGLLRELRDITSEYAWDADLEARVDAALSQQAEPTDTYTAVDMATAAAQGFMDGQAAVEQATAQDGRELPPPYGWVSVGKFFTDREKAIEAAEKTPCIEVYSRPQMLTRPAQTEQQPVAYADPQAFVNFGKARQDGIEAGPRTHEWMWANPGSCLVPLYAAPIAQTAPSVCMGCVDLSSHVRELQHKMDYYKAQTAPQPEQGGLSDPRQWTDQQVLDFLGVALRNVDVVGTVHLSEIRQGFELVMGRPAMPDQGGARE